jgi:hypothetical protein
MQGFERGLWLFVGLMQGSHKGRGVFDFIKKYK